MCVNVASLLKFSDLCQAFEETRQLKKQEKSNALTSFIRQFKGKAVELKNKHDNAVISFYPVLRLILPHLERERGPYGLKEFTLGKRIVKLLCLPPQGADALRLTNFRATDNSNVKDFADSAYWVLRKHFTDSTHLSVLEVNQHLDAIAMLHAESNPRGVDEQIAQLFKKTNADEQVWLIRIILKELKLGLGQDRILKLYHPDAADLFSVSNNLATVCDRLSDTSIRLHEIEISLFSPFRPMLSNRCDVKQFRKVFTNTRRLFVETKFDGERFQIHMKNDRFKYFSRNGFDFTSTYGDSFSSGHYTPLLKNLFNTNVKSVILDGEMMGWNKKTQKFGSKGMDFDVKHLKPHNTYQPCFCVFDVLLLNDEVLTNKPLEDRLTRLDGIVRPLRGVLQISKRTETSNKEDIIKALNKSMDDEEEGIVFKDTTSLYKSNDRNGGWWKMKLEYFENVMSDLDVIVLGGYYGDGRYRRKISGFLVGVSVNNGNDIPSEYISFAKISSGLNEEELKITEEKLGSHWSKIKDANPEDFGVFFGKEKPDVWIRPSDSIVFLVRGSELIQSSDFKTNCTLRFPRIQKIRLDKPYYDSLSLKELQELTGPLKPVHKLSKRHLEVSDLEVVEKERKVRRRCANVELLPVEKKTELLAGHEFCVLTGWKEWKKEDVETCIRENGGTIVLNEGKISDNGKSQVAKRLYKTTSLGRGTLCVLVGDHHPRINICKDHGSQCDLVKLKWLKDIIETRKFKFFSPIDCICTTQKTKNRFLSEYDKYGDSYTESVTSNVIPDIIDAVTRSGDYIHLNSEEIDCLEKEIGCENDLRVFKNTTAYFDSCAEDEFVPEKEILKFLGGTVNRTLNEEVNLVISNTQTRSEETAQLRPLNNNASIETKDYVRTKLAELL